MPTNELIAYNEHLQKENAALRSLVREIISEIRAYGYSMPKILSRPEIKAIMEET